jgi:hypothetical protein
LNPDGTKLSKRSGAVNVNLFKEQGVLPMALLNFVAMLGWRPDGNKELFFSLDELVDAFDPLKINKSAPIVDRSKLEWINHKHMLHASSSSPDTLNHIITLYRARLLQSFECPRGSNHNQDGVSSPSSHTMGEAESSSLSPTPNAGPTLSSTSTSTTSLPAFDPALLTSDHVLRVFSLAKDSYLNLTDLVSGTRHFFLHHVPPLDAKMLAEVWHESPFLPLPPSYPLLLFVFVLPC